MFEASVAAWCLNMFSWWVGKWPSPWWDLAPGAPGEVREKMEDLPSLEAQLEALRVELRELDEKRREEELRLKAFEKEIWMDFQRGWRC